MLNSFCKGACALAAVMTLSTGAALADNQSVLIVDGSFFPSTIYARPGDNVIFTNQSGKTSHIRGPEGSWASGPIADNGTYRLNLTHSTPLEFTSVDGNNQGLFDGSVSYDPAPLDE